MKLHIHRSSKVTTTALLLLLKPITDMFYQYQVLDYAMMGLAILALLINVRKIKHLYWVDLIVLAIVTILSFTLIRSGFSGVVIYIKMISAYLLYFIGRSCGNRLFKERKYLVYAEVIVLLANCFSLVTRSGFQTWGHATTFSGLYFFKTDLALAMVYAVVTLLYLSDFKWIYILVASLLGVIMIFLSNTRMDMVIMLVLLFVYVLYIREKKSRKLLRINMRFVVIGITSLVGGIYIISKILTLPAFRSFNYISFSFNKLFDLYNASNTSGRTVVWDAILRIFNSKPLIQRLIGIDFVSDYYLTYDSHNAYIKMMFTGGYICLGLFILLLFMHIAKLNNTKNRNMFYFNLSVLIAFTLQSVSASTVIYTQSTWIFMLFFGAIITSWKTVPIEDKENEQ